MTNASLSSLLSPPFLYFVVVNPRENGADLDSRLYKHLTRDVSSVRWKTYQDRYTFRYKCPNLR